MEKVSKKEECRIDSQDAFDEAFQMIVGYYEGYEVDDTLNPFYSEE